MRKEDVARRREFVDSYDAIGFKTMEIVIRLRELMADNKIEEIATKNLYRLVRKDLVIVRERRKELLYTGEAEKTKREYIAQQKEIMKRAIAHKDYHTASDVADKIAQARGVDIEQIVKFKGDKEHPISIILNGVKKIPTND